MMENINLIPRQNSNETTLLKSSVTVGRHLEDIDDLTDGMDTELKPLSPEVKKEFDLNVDNIVSNTKIKNFNRILIISSPLQRAYSTSILFKDCIKERASDFNVAIRTDERFTELSHGDIVLPEDYVPGKRIEFLKDAWRIFWAETFTEDGSYNNPNYCFGDPIVLDDNICKYPEIVGSFSSYGESYRELCQRYYEAILDYLENRERIESAKINLVLVAHSATLAILTELKSVADDIVHNAININTGDLMKVCWQRYLERINSEKNIINFGEVKTFVLEDINDDVILFLKNELAFIKNPENYA